MDASDIIEIHQLLGIYGHVVDAGDWDRFGDLFTPDAVLDYTGVRAPRVFGESTRSASTSATPTIRQRTT